MIEKAGALAGVRTVMTLVPDKSGHLCRGESQPHGVPRSCARILCESTTGIDPAIDQQEILALNAQIAKLVAPPPVPTNPGQFVGTLQSLVGVYENDYYGRCAMLLDGDALKVECGPAKYPATLKHWNNGAFVMQFPGATQAPTLTTFTIGVDGKAESFTMRKWVYSRV